MKKETIYRVFSHLPELSTERLKLRKMMVLDSKDMFEYAQQEEVTKYLTWYPHTNENYTKEYLQYIGSRYAAGQFYDWALILESENKMIGTCGFTSFTAASNVAEIGYVLNPKYQKQGIGTEAVERVIRFGFEELKLHRIEAHFMAGNEASLALMKKVGMTFEGFLRDAMLIKGKYETIGICSILESEWNNKALQH